MNKSDREILRAAFRRPIAFHPAFADIAGSAAGGIFLSQLWYWSERTNDTDGWIYKTYEEWHQETRLSRSEIDRARRSLKSSGALEEKKQGVPCKLFYRLNEDAIIDSLRNLQTGLQDPTDQFAESCKLDCRIQQTGLQNPANDLYIQRVLTESTPESTHKSACENSKPAAQNPVPPPEPQKIIPPPAPTAPPAPVEVIPANPYDNAFLYGNERRRDYREAMGKRNAINPERFETVEHQNDFWRQSVARMMATDKKMESGVAERIATGYCRQINAGDNSNPQAWDYYHLWQQGQMANIPVANTGKDIELSAAFKNFLED